MNDKEHILPETVNKHLVAVSPDFRTWAENIITMARQFGTAQDEIERALQSAFEQGYYLGKRKSVSENNWEKHYDV